MTNEELLRHFIPPGISVSLKRKSRYVDFLGLANFTPISLNDQLRNPFVLFVEGSGEGCVRSLDSLKEYKFDHCAEKQISWNVRENSLCLQICSVGPVVSLDEMQSKS